MAQAIHNFAAAYRAIVRAGDEAETTIRGGRLHLRNIYTGEVAPVDAPATTATLTDLHRNGIPVHMFGPECACANCNRNSIDDRYLAALARIRA